ncbi:DUF4327 family protein [Cyanobacterium aponinum UTEX 3222]|uniref:DUF4327 domain-containing protein n=3 Tax=Cyanobacterium aponinum TaxID=379064 RepID=K9Z309_CYAAP|nr:DUF4327 family protein [Cyanobacterium aponinum]WRL41587.1 DUF4327 family protein [Cyanobacterium aponinum UTEX 3222]AFZ53544.1 hypothetical protein Cyan10605_1433 [Cyanobacterium aponinum PCC 10605]MBD2395431.1 DUF4327 family protein [Cyanobacterium aponinum FACHB-4101]MTF38452.1 DUF4327 family protein [Cyanobacterium aponinum 0216]PHV63504.1 DUF4327 domain-containing protein [Cyanobacterium aponinum IPPAS B-1201]
MTTQSIIPSYNHDLNFIRDEIRALLEKGCISRHQPLYVLANYVPPREWLNIERQLEEKDFLLRDRICDLLTEEKWDND